MSRKGVSLTLADRLVNWFDPVAGQRRMHARALQAATGGYAGASDSARTLRTWYTQSRSADADISGDLARLRERSRDLARNHPLAGGALHTIVTRTVGTGLALQPRPDRRILGWDEEQAADWKSAVEAEWRLWAESPWCDVTGRLDFYGLQELVFRASLESGDAFTLLPMVRRATLPYRLAVQVLEADRVGNPDNRADTAEWVRGIELDPTTGAPRRYYVYDSHPGDLHATNRWKGRWVPATTGRGTPALLHHYRMLRPGQTRGVPHLAPVIEALKQLGRYTEAEIMAAVISGMLTVFVESDAPESNPLLAGTDDAGAPTAGSEDVRLEAGAIVGLSPGEKANVVNPGRPNPAFDPFVMAVMKQIAVGLELPFEVLLKSFTSSYSASRAALLDAWQFFRARRDWLRKSFCQPIYEAWLEEAVALGRVAAPGFLRDPLMRAAYCRAQWTGDSAGSLDPVKEVTAWKEAIALGIATREQAEMEMYGTDWAATWDQKVCEHERMTEAGLLAAPAAANSTMPAAPSEDPEDPEDPADPEDDPADPTTGADDTAQDAAGQPAEDD